MILLDEGEKGVMLIDSSQQVVITGFQYHPYIAPLFLKKSFTSFFVESRTGHWQNRSIGAWKGCGGHPLTSQITNSFINAVMWTSNNIKSSKVFKCQSCLVFSPSARALNKMEMFEIINKKENIIEKPTTRKT